MKKRSLLLAFLATFLIGCSYNNNETKEPEEMTLENDIVIDVDTLDVLKLENEDKEEGIISARILQGVINKEKVRVYYYDYRTFVRNIDVGQERFDILSTSGINFNYLELDRVGSHAGYVGFWTLFNKYKEEIQNIYVYQSYDENPIVSDSINVAAMLAGRNHGVAVNNDIYEALVAEGYAKTRKVVNVVKQFGFDDESSPFYSNFGINKWISQNMIEGSNKDYLFLLSTSPRDPNSNTISYHTAYDYAVSTDSLIYHINPLLDTQVVLQKKILDQFPDNSYVIGWPGINMEGQYVKSVSQCGKGVVCADWSYANGSVFAGFEKWTNKNVIYPRTSNEDVYKDKVYVSFTLSDGDAWHYMTREFLSYFKSSIRGSVPIGWEVSNIFTYVNPLFLKYFYDNATEKDEIMQGVGGITYIQPSNYPDDAYQGYLKSTRKLFDENNVSSVNYWDEVGGSYEKDSKRLVDYCNVVNPNALVMGHAEVINDYFMVGDTVCYSSMGVDKTRGTQTKDEVIANIDKATSRTQPGCPTFVNVNIEAWGQGVTTVKEAYDELLLRSDSYKYEFVLPYQMANLIRSYLTHGANKEMSDAEKINPTAVTFKPNTPEETQYTFDGWDYKSAVNSTNPNAVNRYADRDAYFMYKFNVQASSMLTVTINLRGQYIIKASTDLSDWKEVARADVDSGDAIVGFSVLEVLPNYSGVFYLRFEDSDVDNGFGPGVYSITYLYK